jgi:hypothetical protein
MAEPLRQAFALSAIGVFLKIDLLVIRHDHHSLHPRSDRFSIPLSPLHTGIGQRHGQRERRQGEETHPTTDQPFEGSIALLPARAVLRTLATTPTSRSHGLRRLNSAGRRGCLIRAPIWWSRSRLPAQGWIACLPLEMDQNGCQPPMTKRADAHRHSSNRADVAVGGTRLNPTTTSSCACATPQYALTLSRHSGGRDRSLSEACSGGQPTIRASNSRMASCGRGSR